MLFSEFENHRVSLFFICWSWKPQRSFLQPRGPASRSWTRWRTERLRAAVRTRRPAADSTCDSLLSSTRVCCPSSSAPTSWTPCSERSAPDECTGWAAQRWEKIPDQIQHPSPGSHSDGNRFWRICSTTPVSGQESVHGDNPSARDDPGQGSSGGPWHEHLLACVWMVWWAGELLVTTVCGSSLRHLWISHSGETL